MYNIVMASDNNYAQHLGVALVSLFANNTNLRLKVWVFESGIEKEKIERIESVVLNYHQEIEFVHLDVTDFDGFPINSYYSLVTYFRLRLGDYLDSNIERVLYIDVDAIVCGPIRELLEWDLCSNAIGAVKDTPWMLNTAADYLWHDKVNIKDYFNAGVLVIDMQRYRAASVFNQAIEIVNSGRELMYLDQDILNIIFENSWAQLPCKWNVLNGFLRRQYQDGSSRAKEIMDGIQNRAIIHYSAKEKPWMWRCENPLKGEYFKYLRMSPWKDYRMNLSLYEKLVFVKRYFKSLLRPTYIRLR